MTPKQLYEMTPESTEKSLYPLAGCYYNHLPEAGDSHEWISSETDRVEVRTIKYFDYDGRRYWRLATVWFDSKPVMVIQNAGREGDDHRERFVTDHAQLMAMASHVRSLMKPEEPRDVVAIDADLPELTDFYGQSLAGPFEQYRY